MKTFNEFLTEVRRDRKRATKLLNRVYQKNRFNKIDNSLRKGYGDDMVSTVPWTEIHNGQFRKGGEYINISHFLSQPLQRIPIEHIVSNQERVSRSVISRKIHGKWKEHTPDEPHLIHHNGKYHVEDGNHQVNRDRFRGKKFVLARVVHADELKNEEFINESKITIFRGESVHNKKGGPMGGRFYSLDREFAKQFTQSGQDHEVKSIEMDEKHIMDKSHIYAGDAIEPHLKEAKSKGFKAVRFNEGKDQPHSIYVMR